MPKPKAKPVKVRESKAQAEERLRGLRRVQEENRAFFRLLRRRLDEPLPAGSIELRCSRCLGCGSVEREVLSGEERRLGMRLKASVLVATYVFDECTRCDGLGVEVHVVGAA